MKKLKFILIPLLLALVANAQPGPVPCTPPDFKPVNDNCNLYLACTSTDNGGVWVVYSCPGATYYNCETFQCSMLLPPQSCCPDDPRWL